MQRSVSPQSQELGPTAWVGGTNNADCMPTSIDNSYETAVIQKNWCPGGARAQIVGGAQYDAARTNNKQRPKKER